jgi:molecular chaperone HscB
MNYFELFNVPVTLKPDKAKIKHSFYELSRKYHPDFYINDTEMEQQFALEQTAIINKAFKVLCNEEEIIKYILQIKELLTEDEKYTLPSDFLMEVMELNEQLTDAKLENNEAQIASLLNNINQFKQNIYEPVKSIFENAKETVYSQEELLQVKDYYFKKKYLNRILAGLD